VNFFKIGGRATLKVINDYSPLKASKILFVLKKLSYTKLEELIKLNNEQQNIFQKDLDEETLFLITQTFKALSDPTRLRILYLLFQGEHSVNEIAEKLSLVQSTVSHQLRFLKNLRLVKFRREGTSLYYSYDDDHVMSIIAQTIDHTNHH